MSYSVVIPVYNEEESLLTLYQEIRDVAVSLEEEMEIIFIDDGSSDQSWQVIETIADQDSRVSGIRFRRNFGKAAALDAGFKKATHHYIITLDADLQDDPQEIPDFLRLLQSGLDVVSGWKKTRHDPWHKVIPSHFFNGMVSYLTGVRLHDHNCGMKGYLREIFDEITLYGELHRFIPVLAAARGYKVGEKVVQHRARKFGHSKYGFTRFIKGFLDLLTVKFITGYGQRPQHLLGTIGLIAFGIGGLMMTYLACCWGLSRIPLFQWEPYHLSNRPAVIYSAALMLLGGQLLSIGIIAELLLSYHHRSSREYSIKETISHKKTMTSQDKSPDSQSK